LSGTARYHARWRELTADEEAAALAVMHEMAAGRADLLAEVADVALGFYEGELEEPLTHQATGLCRKAGAGEEAIPGGSRRGGAGGRTPVVCRSVRPARRHPRP